ncbi:MAG: hypothetical protein AAFR03_06550 [Pseudomonadota bacterium]
MGEFLFCSDVPLGACLLVRVNGADTQINGQLAPQILSPKGVISRYWAVFPMRNQGLGEARQGILQSFSLGSLSSSS